MVSEATQALGRIDVLVNNAALFTEDPGDLADGGSRRVDHRLHDTDYDDWVAAWRRTVDVNLLGTANVTWCVVRQMLDVPAARGSRPDASSTWARAAPTAVSPTCPPTAPPRRPCTPSASRSRCHSAGTASPSPPSRPGSSPPTWPAELDGPAGDPVRAQSPFGRVAEPDEVAAAVVFLADPLSQWASGAVLDLNGASYLR